MAIETLLFDLGKVLVDFDFEVAMQHFAARSSLTRDAFERVYATPTGADIGALCAGYGVPHRTVQPKDLAAALEEQTSGIRVLEVPLDRLGRQGLTAAIDDAAAAAVQR